MKKTLKITIPDYFTVKHYKALSHIQSLDEIEQMAWVISTTTETDIDEVMRWDLPSVVSVYKQVNEIIKNIKAEFYPVIEWNGELYGFSNMSKMSLGEYIDFESYTKDTNKNLNKLLSILYRPITENKMNTGKFIAKSSYKALKYDIENVFDYYKIEEYDSDNTIPREDNYDQFPAEVALGALSFFLDTNAILLSSSQIYSLAPMENQIKKEMSKMNKMKRRLLNTMAGYIHSMNLVKRPSYPSQEIKQ
jgi:hypothetical protein